MLGHKAYQVLSSSFDTHVTFRRFGNQLRQTGLFDAARVVDGVDAFDFKSVERAVHSLKPDVVLNCIGLIKQLKDANDPKQAIYINALFPHLVAGLCSKSGCRLIHISTDCVFSGKRGNYTEVDFSDAEDLYGRTKFLGEVHGGNCLTLRTSVIGRELFSTSGLIEWFLSSVHKTVSGYVNAIYTGLTTIALCKEIQRVIEERPSLSGLYQISAEKISKFRLLSLVKKVYHLDVELLEDHEFKVDRSLDSTRYRMATSYVPPAWEQMIQEMHDDPTSYNNWRKNGSH